MAVPLRCFNGNKAYFILICQRLYHYTVSLSYAFFGNYAHILRSYLVGQWHWCFYMVSIHTSLWDVTPCLKVHYQVGKGFNPHIPMGCDLSSNHRLLHPYKVSIHTSIWDVTTVEALFVKRIKGVSIHTSLWDVTTGCSTPMSRQRLFQSTHPYGM